MKKLYIGVLAMLGMSIVRTFRHFQNSAPFIPGNSQPNKKKVPSGTTDLLRSPLHLKKIMPPSVSLLI